MMPRMLTSRLMPTNRTANSPAAQVRVVRALRHSGGLNAGTPSDTASTPVSATAPDEKARRTSSRPSAPSAPLVSSATHSGGGVYGGMIPAARPMRPNVISPSTATMYRYVGAM